MRLLGIDLAWGAGSEDKAPCRSGVVALEVNGEVSAAGWTTGLDATMEWVQDHAADDTVLFIDAPLVITNLTKQRLTDKQVGQRYGRWWVSANSVNAASKRQAGVHLRERLEALGWRYDDGMGGPPKSGRTMSECYPYTTIVGAPELGYTDKRPGYKRAPKGMKRAEFMPKQLKACDELIARVGTLAQADPSMDIRSHDVTARLINEPSPASPKAYKQREDLLDAAICAWTAALWVAHGTARCQILGGREHDGGGGLLATIIAPARAEQRG